MSDTSIYCAYKSDDHVVTVSKLIGYLQDIKIKHGDLPVTISVFSCDRKHFDAGVPDIAIDINKKSKPVVVIHETCGDM